MRRPLVARVAAGTLAVVLLAAAGCGRGDEQDPRAAEARVGRRLYAENLVADREVSARVRAAVQGMERDGLPADSALQALDTWLEEWVAHHPERAARARMLPGAAPSALTRR